MSTHRTPEEFRGPRESPATPRKFGDFEEVRELRQSLGNFEGICALYSLQGTLWASRNYEKVPGIPKKSEAPQRTSEKPRGLQRSEDTLKKSGKVQETPLRFMELRRSPGTPE